MKTVTLKIHNLPFWQRIRIGLKILIFNEIRLVLENDGWYGVDDICPTYGVLCTMMICAHQKKDTWEPTPEEEKIIKEVKKIRKEKMNHKHTDQPCTDCILYQAFIDDGIIVED